MKGPLKKLHPFLKKYWINKKCQSQYYHFPMRILWSKIFRREAETRTLEKYKGLFCFVWKFAFNVFFKMKILHPFFRLQQFQSWWNKFFLRKKGSGKGKRFQRPERQACHMPRPCCSTFCLDIIFYVHMYHNNNYNTSFFPLMHNIIKR